MWALGKAVKGTFQRQQLNTTPLALNNNSVFSTHTSCSIFTQVDEAMADKAFFAKVQWWDSWIVHVLCPFCIKIHTHGFGGGYDSVHRRSHCRSSPQLSLPSYQFKYPFSQVPEMIAHEIDKASERYVALDVDPPRPGLGMLNDDFVDLTLNQKPVTALEKWDDAFETITIEGRTDTVLRRLQETFNIDDEASTLKRIEHVSSRMITFGDEDCVWKYLDSSSESRIFLHGVNSDGNSALWLAAYERFPAVVKLLLDRGANADFQNKDGRTPLMQAALWGRYGNVRYLLSYSADKGLQDRDGFKAIHLADTSDRNEEERYWCSGGEHQVYREVTYTANQARRMIVHLLKDAEDETLSGSKDDFKNQVYQKSVPGTIKFIAPIAEYPISSQWKTIARLERGYKYPTVAAMSGWGHEDTITTISGRDWTSEVIRVAKFIGYALAPHESLDHDRPGQFYACHAEKQLIAYFISRHVFLKPELDEGGPLHRLATAKPPIMLKQATILVSSPPCDDCIRFEKTMNRHLGLSILLLNGSEIR